MIHADVLCSDAYSRTLPPNFWHQIFNLGLVSQLANLDQGDAMRLAVFSPQLIVPPCFCQLLCTSPGANGAVMLRAVVLQGDFQFGVVEIKFEASATHSLQVTELDLFERLFEQLFENLTANAFRERGRAYRTKVSPAQNAGVRPDKRMPPATSPLGSTIRSLTHPENAPAMLLSEHFVIAQGLRPVACTASTSRSLPDIPKGRRPLVTADFTPALDGLP